MWFLHNFLQRVQLKLAINYSNTKYIQLFMELKILIVLSFLFLVSMSFVVASDVDDIYFEITPPEGFFIGHCSDSTIFMVENGTEYCI